MTLLTFIPDIVFGALNLLLSFFPTLELPTNVTTIFSWFLNLIKPGAYFIDMKSFFQCSIILLSTFTIKFLVVIFNYLVAHIPFLKIGVRQ